MKWRLMRANPSNANEFARISLHFMLDPVQPLEYETGLLYFEYILLFNSRCRTLCHSSGGTIRLTYDYERLLFYHHASLPTGNSMQNFMSEFPKQCESKESLCEMCSFRNNLTETRLSGENLDSDVSLL